MNTCGNPYCNGYCGKCPTVRLFSDSRNVASDGRTNYDVDAEHRIRDAERKVVEAAKAWRELEQLWDKLASNDDVTRQERDVRFRADLALNELRLAVSVLDAAEGA